MKLLMFNDFRLGVLKGDSVVDVTAVVQKVPHTGPGDLMNGLIARWSEYKGPLEKAAAAGKGLPVSQVKIRPPLPKPVNIECMAVNYMEDGTRKAPAPINAFHKSPGCIVGHGDTMILPDIPSNIFEGEAELAVIIGKRAKNVKAADAMSYVWGYVNFIDGSARGVIPTGNSFYQMKSRDTFAPIGPYVVTKDEFGDPSGHRLYLTVNGKIRQDSNTSDLLFGVPKIIESLSAALTLEPGDIICTGTPAGVASGMTPPLWLRSGDVMEATVEGIGTLRNKILG